MSRDLKPLDNNVLLIPYRSKVTSGGIILTDKTTSNTVIHVCIVSAVGPNVQNEEIKEGTVVVIPRRTGKWVDYDGFKYILVNENEIDAILEGASYINKSELEREENRQC